MHLYRYHRAWYVSLFYVPDLDPRFVSLLYAQTLVPANFAIFRVVRYYKRCLRGATLVIARLTGSQ